MPATSTTPTAGLTQTPVIKIEGSPLSNQVHGDLIDVRVQQSLKVASMAELRLRDEDFAYIDGSTFDVGKKLEVGFKSASAAIEPVFKGEIVAVGIDQGAGDRHELVVTAYDRSHRLSHGTRIATYVNMSYSDVIKKIVDRHGLTHKANDLPPNKHPYLLQTTNDREFLDEIAFRVGAEWYVDDKQLVVRKRADAELSATLEFGTNLSRFKVRYSVVDHAANVTVRGWDPATKRELVGTKPVQTSGAGLGTASIGTNGRRSAASLAGGDMVTASTVVESVDEANKMAEGHGSRLASAQLVAKGEAPGVPSLRAGKQVDIKGMGTKLSGKYYLTSVDHTFSVERGYRTRFSAGGLDGHTLVDLLGGGTDRIAPFGQTGLTVGIVTNVDDPDGLNRVKVKMPMLSTSEESNWARVVTLGAGEGRGALFMPQINDEVLVGFEQGDLRRPYVLGGLWGGKAKPWLAIHTQSKKKTAGIKTPGGMTFTFDEEENQKRALSLMLPDGKSRLHIGEDKIELIGEGQQPIEVKTGSASIVLKHTGDITIKGQANITIEATQNLTLKGQAVKIEAQTSAEMKGNASAKVESSGQTEVKGSIVSVAGSGMVKIN